MNDAIQKQLEARLEQFSWMSRLSDEEIVTIHDGLARECAALRQMCQLIAYGGDWVEDEEAQRVWRLDFTKEELTPFKAAAEGRPVT